MKLIIDIPKKTIARIRSNYGHGCKGIYDGDKDKVIDAIYHGTPLDSNSERAELQAYFDGESFGWDEGREALIEEIKAEIDKAQEPYQTSTAYDEGVRFGLMLAYQIVDRCKESEDT